MLIISSMDKRRIAQYNLFQLFRICCFSIGYKLLLWWQHHHIPKTWSIIEPENNSIVLDPKEIIHNCVINKEIINEAEEILRGKIRIFGTEFCIDPIHGWLNDPVTNNSWNKEVFAFTATTSSEGHADVKYVLELNKFNHLVRVAMAYRYTGDTRYIHFIYDAIVGWRETVHPYRSVALRIIMDMSFRIINLLQIIILCFDSHEFKARTLPLISGIIKDHVKTINLFHTARWFKTGSANNHVTGEMIGAILGQLWMEQNGMSVPSRKYEEQCRILVNVLDKTIAKSGAYIEGSSNYSRVVLEFLIAFETFSRILLSEKLCMDIYNSRSYIKRLSQFVFDLSYHNSLPNIGDNDDAHVLVCYQNNSSLDYLPKLTVGKNFSNCDYSDGSFITYHSNDKNDVWIVTRVGKHSYFKEGISVHSHNDLLSVVMGFRGYQIFVDKGCLFYNAGESIRKLDRSFFSHNTAGIDGVEICEISKRGSYFSYPISRCIKCMKMDFNFNFEGSLTYYSIEQTRIICYSDNTVLIKDVIHNGTNISTGSIKYILHSDIDIKFENNKILVSKDETPICNIVFEGLTSVSIESCKYSPSFSLEVESKAIIGVFNAEPIKEIKTIINIL